MENVYRPGNELAEQPIKGSHAIKGDEMYETKPFLLITGMHRSGTSFLARALNLLGVYLGDFEDLVSDDWRNQLNKSDNPRGHWEHNKVLELDEKTLTLGNGSWDQPPTQNVLVNEEIGREISELIRTLVDHPSLAVGFKDDRLLLYLDAWSQYLPRDLVIVGIFRHPLEVAQSLQTRNQFNYEKSLNLWKIYNQNLLYYLGKYDGFLLNFDWAKERIFAEIRYLANKLGLVEKIDLAEWYSEDLIHSSSKTLHYNLTDDIVSLFLELQHRSENNDKVKIKQFTRTSSDLWEVTQGLVSDIQRQGRYFKKIKDQDNRESQNRLWLQLKVRELNESNKALETEVNRAIKDVDILQNINLGHQKTIEEQDAGLNRAIKDVDILQNINLGHQKTIEEKDDQIRQLNDSIKIFDTQLKQAMKDVDTLHTQIKQLIDVNNKTTEEKDTQIKQLIDVNNKTTEEKDTQIKQLIDVNKTMDMELRNLRATLLAIQNGITWRTLTPLKRRYDAIFRKASSNKAKSTPPEAATATTTAATLLQTTTGNQVIKASVPPRLNDKRDIICFPITDWAFRYQRSQHLLSRFANNGHRIFYLTVNLYPEKTPYSVTNIKDNIFEVKLNCIKHFNIYNDVLDKRITQSIFVSLEKMNQDLEMYAFSFIAFPTWAQIAFNLREKYGWPIIYDCLDDHYGFGNVNKGRIEEELKILQVSDLVITTSSYLYKKARRVNDNTLLIPNAGEFDHFKNPPTNDLLGDVKKPIAGYFGAIAEWFDNETVEYVAIKRPDINFVLIGHTFGSNTAKLEQLSNVHFLGEKPYREIPLYLYHFDVCLIPFKLTPLIEATHPVKFYEYLTAGKPVVSTKITELIPYGNLCYLSSNKEDFLTNIDRALAENDRELIKRRIDFASNNTWQDRFDFLYSEVNKIPVSE